MLCNTHSVVIIAIYTTHTTSISNYRSNAVIFHNFIWTAELEADMEGLIEERERERGTKGGGENFVHVL